MDGLLINVSKNNEDLYKTALDALKNYKDRERIMIGNYILRDLYILLSKIGTVNRFDIERTDYENVIIEFTPPSYKYGNLDKLFSWKPMPKKIIRSGPATIVIWDDGTKTVVKLKENDSYDEYTAFTAALAKKLYGSTSATKKMIERKTYIQEKMVRDEHETPNTRLH